MQPPHEINLPLSDHTSSIYPSQHGQCKQEVFPENVDAPQNNKAGAPPNNRVEDKTLPETKSTCICS